MRGYYVSVLNSEALLKNLEAVELVSSKIRDDLTIPTAETDADGVVVKVTASPISADALRFVNGQYAPNLAPFPSIAGTGCVGYVHAIGKDVVSDLEVGELVICTCFIGDSANGIVKGLVHSGTESSKRLQARWRDGSWSEYTLFPASNVYPVRGEYVSKLSPSILSRVEKITVSYSAMLSGGFRAGQIIAVGGATGAIGSGCLAVALALGASKIFALGRRKDALKALVESLGQKAKERVVALATDEMDSEEDFVTEFATRVQSYQPHLYIDAMGITSSTLVTQLGLRYLRNGGTAVLIGGVRGNLTISYGDFVRRGITLKGSFMYPATAPSEVLDLIDARILDVGWMKYSEFELNDIENGMQQAVVEKGERASVLIFPK